MSDIVREVADGQGLRPSAAAKLIPGEVAGKSVCPKTIHNWCKIGHRSQLGVRVYLEHVRTGPRIITTQAAIQRFLSRLNDVEPAKPRPTKRSAAVKAGLRAMGMR